MLSIDGICKSFPGVKALENVSFRVEPGEIHALVGENGAGKSTLTKIIAGAQPADAGTIRFDGVVTEWKSPATAKAAGIHVIYQEFVLFPHLTVGENIFLGHERRNAFGLIDYKKTREEASKLLRRLGINIDPDLWASELTVAEQQMLEIAKALVHEVKFLILDEPTAVISGKETDLLFGLLRKLRAEGVAVLYISHRMDEIFELCDRVTVLKDGCHVATVPISHVDHDGLVGMMVGRDLRELFPPKAALSGTPRPVLRARDISIDGFVKSASIDLNAGEVTALAGMVGAGRTELAMALFGGIEMDAGEIELEGRTYHRMSPALAISEGMGFLTEDRKSQGLAMQLDVAANISVPDLASISRFGFISHRKERAIARTEIENYRIACRGPGNPVANMSGGNQQKVLVARWARTARKVIILDEPTRGVDIGAKAEIYRIIRELANRGLAVLIISSELPEVIGLADRVVVMREGVVTGEVLATDATEEGIIALATKSQAPEVRA